MTMIDYETLRIGLRLAYGKFLGIAQILRLMRELPLDKKIAIADVIIHEAVKIAEEFYGSNCKICISFSGGKASLVVLDRVVRHVDPNRIIVMFEDTGLEFPESKQYVIDIVKNYYKLKLAIVRPKVRPFQIWKLFGFPRPGRTGYYEPACCLILRKLGAYVFYKKFDIKVEFTGLQASEGLHRKYMIAQGGCVRPLSGIAHLKFKEPIIAGLPVAIWSDQDCWVYIKQMRIPPSPVYEKYKVSRYSCIICTNIWTWKENLERIDQVWHSNLVQKVENLIKKFGYQTKKYTPQEIVNKVMKEFGFKSIEDMYTIEVI